MDFYLEHKGVGHLDGGNSGRYPWGSGERGYQRCKDLVDLYRKLKKDGNNLSDDELAEALKISKEELYSRLNAEKVTRKSSGNMSEKEIATVMGLSVNKLKARYSIADDTIRKHNIEEAARLRKEHPDWSNAQIGKELNPEKPFGESLIRSWTDPSLALKANKTAKVAEVLFDAVERDQYIDVGGAVEKTLGITRTRLDTALE